MSDDDQRGALDNYQQLVQEYLQRGGRVLECRPRTYSEDQPLNPMWPRARRGKAQTPQHQKRRAEIKEENAQKLLAVLDPRLTLPELARAAGVHPGTAGQYMQILRKRGLTTEWDEARDERRKKK